MGSNLSSRRKSGSSRHGCLSSFYHRGFFYTTPAIAEASLLLRGPLSFFDFGWSVILNFPLPRPCPAGLWGRRLQPVRVWVHGCTADTRGVGTDQRKEESCHHPPRDSRIPVPWPGGCELRNRVSLSTRTPVFTTQSVPRGPSTRGNRRLGSKRGRVRTLPSREWTCVGSLVREGTPCKVGSRGGGGWRDHPPGSGPHNLPEWTCFMSCFCS